MKITAVEAIHLRMPEVRGLCDSGREARIIRASTDGARGIGEADPAPPAAGSATLADCRLDIPGAPESGPDPDEQAIGEFRAA